LSRSTNALIKSASHEIVIDPRIADIDTRRIADQIFLNLPRPIREFVGDPSWLSLWVSYSQKAAAVIEAMEPWSEPSICRLIAGNLKDGSSLYLSSSRPIRDIEGFAFSRSGIETFANRGLAGIDGNISTAMGIAFKRASTTALVGDLSFLHDHNGLLSSREVALRIIVFNNDGGGIFSTLPQNGVDGFEKIFGTPHGLDIAAISAALGIATMQVSDISTLKKEISSPVVGLSVIIVQLPSRESNAQTLKTLYEKMATL
jgi:2-succinyl-5-enolpyruvyl-6-hydroxy-3-cyclohexene-1-carboxylate synthase